MPAEVVDDPLGVRFTLSDGSSAMVAFRDTANPQLAQELLVGLASMVSPHGKLDSSAIIRTYVATVRDLTARLAVTGYCGDARGLTRAKLATVWWETGSRSEGRARRMLAALDDERGLLKPDVRELIDGRIFGTRRRKAEASTPLAPYGEAEWVRLSETCRGLVKESFADHRQMLMAARLGRDPIVGGFSLENICWQLVHNGPSTARSIGAAAGLTRSASQQRFPGMLTQNASLFPTVNTVTAYRILFGVYTGIVPDGIDDLGLGDLDWAGDATILLRYVKGRTGRESVTLNRRAVRLLEQWLEHSALMRRFAPAALANELWLWRNPFGDPGEWQAGRGHSSVMTRWVQGLTAPGTDGQPVLALTGDDGRPLSIHRHRIRTTFESLRDRKAWFGSTRATIDPNHSPAVEGDHYLTVATHAQKSQVEAIIAQAQSDLLRKAQPPTVLSTEQTVELAERFPELVAELRIDDAATAELTGGRRDVFVAACADPLSGLHGPKGKPCPARPWVCLLCPLAVFAPRHGANLLRMKAFFARQWRQMPAPGFMAIFGPYAQRIDRILERYDPAILAAVANEIRDNDDELPLRPEETTA